MKKPYEMTFDEFASSIEPNSWIWASRSFLNMKVTYSVEWREGEIASRLPEIARAFQFDREALLQDVVKLGLDPSLDEDNALVANFLALRLAWIEYLKSSVICYGENELRSALSFEVALDFVLLSSSLNHHWIHNKVQQHLIHRNPIDTKPVTADVGLLTEDESHLWQTIHARTLAEAPNEDITYFTEAYQFEDGCWTSEFDMNAFFVQCDINNANRRIEELQNEMDEQEKIRRTAKKLITKFKQQNSEIVARAAHRPVQSEERRNVARKFTSEWIKSLKNSLEASSYGDLVKLIKGSNSANWCRWENQKATITSSTLDGLLKSVVSGGKYKGRKLRDVPSKPAHDELLALVSIL